uniref:(northern house mosquito) hypothetical protein n=1 Tax=Culex pipiens TaxID=7175 RepID=A0A8D8HIW5_CULPI
MPPEEQEQISSHKYQTRSEQRPSNCQPWPAKKESLVCRTDPTSPPAVWPAKPFLQFVNKDVLKLKIDERETNHPSVACHFVDRGETELLVSSGEVTPRCSSSSSAPRWSLSHGASSPEASQGPQN